MNRTVQYIRTLMMLLMMLGGTINELWATATKVTYHIITLPFGYDSKHDCFITENPSTNVDTKYRIEALKCEVECDTEDKIELPAKYKSPLLKENAYTYYKGITKSALTKIFKNNDTQFYTYSAPTDPITENEKVGSTKNIYVYYTWDGSTKTDFGEKLDLTGGKKYNIEFKSSQTTESWFFATNMDQGRGNRAQAIPTGHILDYLDLSTKGPHEIKEYNISRKNFDFMWKLVNNDPYNIILETAYEGDFIYVEECYSKKLNEARVYGILQNGKPTNYWMTNEWIYAWPVKNASNAEDITPINPGPPTMAPGWFRNNNKFPDNNWGVKTNGVSSGLYFSFSLLNRTAAEGDYTMVASWADVDGKEWVPNNDKQYLHLGHYTTQGVNKGYPGPTFSTFDKADKIVFHEIRDYTFKVKTPLSNTTLETVMPWSDYYKAEEIKNHIPKELQRKYVTYTDPDMWVASTGDSKTSAPTFEDVFTNYEEAEFDGNARKGEVWINYTPNMPFNAAKTTSPDFTQLEWYNIHADKDERYTVWYDTSSSTQFSTYDSSVGTGHSKYGHDSHFAFIGDPYELYVISRQASEDQDKDLRALSLNATITNPMGVEKVTTYTAVPNGTTLTVGNIYYTSATGAGKFVYRKADGTNYYEKKQYVAIPARMKLGKGMTYYTSDSGAGEFIASGSEVSNGTNYFYKFTEPCYIAVPAGTTLTVGGEYYTYNPSTGEYTLYTDIATGDLKSVGTNYYEVKNIWELVYDTNSGKYAECFRLRQFNSYVDSVCVNWGSDAKKGLVGSKTAAIRLTAKKLPMMYYTYYIVNGEKNIAVKATEEQVTGITLSYENIPEIIRSPFLEGVPLTFRTYNEASDLTAGAYTSIINEGTGGTAIKDDTYIEIETTNSNEDAPWQNHIFVFYDKATLSELHKTILADTKQFYVSLKNEYIYYDTDGGTPLGERIKSIENIPSGIDLNPYIWVLGNNDPYAMTIRNEETDEYVKVAGWADDAVLGWVSDIRDASRFIIKRGSEDLGTYEVMATTGETVDAGTPPDGPTTYYNIGRMDDKTVRIYSNSTYEHGYSNLAFLLTETESVDILYHLIDKQGKDLLQVTARQVAGSAPLFPTTYWSPLVDKYYYHDIDQFTDPNTHTTPVMGNSSAVYKLIDNPTPKTTVAEKDHIFVTYDANTLVDMHHTTMYLLKFAMGTPFYAEDGSDGLEKQKVTPVYPYCNGDCNFNIYGQDQFDVQLNGAASTRTRWAWYVESGDNDPYHVKIFSRQTETYDGVDRNAYFATYIPDGQKDNKKEVVTNLVWPNISGVQATDYMVLGSVGQYQLVTSYTIPVDLDGNGYTNGEGESNKRYVLNTFEQYWKTYDLIRRKVLEQSKAAYPDNPNDAITVPETPFVVDGYTTGDPVPEHEGETWNNRTYLEYEKDWHSYSKMAYAKRWNGYNNNGEAKKGWEKIEHWFETVKMGEGYFNFVPFTVDPALILLDQHGWEIMRKPLPSSPDDPDKEKKYDAIRPYDSPMVKEYIFWSSAKKRSGFHQYYALDKRIGGDFTSTSLTSLPPHDSENVHDAKGNLNDQYVTYIVKDEYVQSYRPGTAPTADPFLIRQGSKLAKNDGTATIAKVDVSGRGGVSQYVIDNIGLLTLNGSKKNELWYVRPNPNIDEEMGYATVNGKKNYDWGTTNPNAYGEDSPYYTAQVADLIVNTAAYKALTTDDDKKAFTTKYGQFTFSNGFDPYNIQISSTSSSTEKFFTLHLTNSIVDEGIMQGDYTGTGGSTAVTLNEKNGTTVTGTGYDNSKWYMTNQTFMAVQDADGNMQLMPRFDHNLRVQDFSTLVTPEVDLENPEKLTKTYTQLYRPYVYNYRIIDNSGREALRYKSGGELVPQTPDHFKSPLAKDFKYYKTATYEEGTKTYSIEESTDHDTSPQEITKTSSMAGAGKYDSGSSGNPIYVRYAYDEEADVQHVLQGKWLSMQIADANKYYNSGILTLAGEKDPDKNDWHWKFLRTPHTDPDPYAVQILNDSHGYDSDNNPIPDKPMSAAGLGQTDASETIISANASSTYQYFALLNHTASDGTTNGYALAVTRTAIDDQYWFVNGYPASANIAKEDGFRNTSCAFDESASVNSKVVLIDDIGHKYIYLIYTNDKVFAASATQTHSEARENDYIPVLPASIQSPLLNSNQFVFYEKEEDMDVEGKELENLYGLYEDTEYEDEDHVRHVHESHVYVRYKPYDTTVTEYKVPNHKDTKDGHVARSSDSNDAPIHLDGKLPYNIVWYNDNMMKKDGSNVKGKAGQELNSGSDYVWRLDGDDPYAIIMKKGTDSYISVSNTDVISLSATPTTFMLLPQNDYEYGVLAVTGKKDKMLTMTDDGDPDDDDPLSITAADPTKFIIFALGAENIIYHLVIANIKDSHGTTKWKETIPWRKPEDRYNGASHEFDWNEEETGYNSAWSASDTKDIKGTSMRDLTSFKIADPSDETKPGEGSMYGDQYQLGDIKVFPDLNGTAGKQTYCVEYGPISLGDNLAVPSDFYRPNVVYTFIVHDIQEDTGGGTWKSNKELNDKFKGMEISSNKMSTDEAFLGKKVYVNIVYTFDGDLDSNSGEDFVSSISQNKWYTLVTMIDDTPWLAQYTNAWGFELKEGYGTHYTNDFLWTPIGDPYGFQLYNRYMDINSGGDNLGEKNKVLMTEDFRDNETTVTGATTVGQTNITSLTGESTVNGTTVFMGDFKTDQTVTVIPGQTAHHVDRATISANSVYELLEGNIAGYFKFHPVVDANQHGLNVVDAKDASGAEHRYVRLCKAPADFTFGLTKQLMKPYFDRAGYVGGLKKSVYDNEINKDVVDEMKKSSETMDFALLMKAQSLVYDLENNIVPFETGYYRLHSPLGLSGIDPSRYASGYTHKIELDKYEGKDIPMHFYEMDTERVLTFTDLKEGFTFSHATRGDLPIVPVEKDAASIFYFKKRDGTGTRENFTTISTEGLYVKGTVGKGYDETAGKSNFEGNAHRAAAVMTATEANAQELFVMDIGGGILLIHDNETADGRIKLKYFCFDYSNDLDDKPTIYDLKMTHNTHTDHAKWCMQPVQKSAKKGVNEMGLKLDLHRGGDGYYYATFYAPFDVLLTDAKKDTAYVCNIWDTDMIHLKKVGKYNTADNGYKGSNQFVPAGTPVIIRSSSTSVVLALPKNEPASTPLSCIFKGEYLEQLLAEKNNGSNDVYTFGLPVDGISTVSGYNDDGEHNGELTAVLPHTADKGVGFFVNANPNREAFGARGGWIRNNRYVYGNRIYYRADAPSGSRRQTSSLDFIPVVFDDDDDEEDKPIEESLRNISANGYVYDLQGRCVASGEAVRNGSWRNMVAPGVYIVNGKKVKL